MPKPFFSFNANPGSKAHKMATTAGAGVLLALQFLLPQQSVGQGLKKNDKVKQPDSVKTVVDTLQAKTLNNTTASVSALPLSKHPAAKVVTLQDIEKAAAITAMRHEGGAKVTYDKKGKPIQYGVTKDSHPKAPVGHLTLAQASKELAKEAKLLLGRMMPYSMIMAATDASVMVGDKKAIARLIAQSKDALNFIDLWNSFLMKKKAPSQKTKEVWAERNDDLRMLTKREMALEAESAKKGQGVTIINHTPAPYNPSQQKQTNTVPVASTTTERKLVADNIEVAPELPLKTQYQQSGREMTGQKEMQPVQLKTAPVLKVQ